MGGFSNFAISFSIISILTGAVILYDYGLAWAGTAAVLIGWPLVTVFVLLIAAAMSEIASAYPTAGGLYYWASKMKNKNWGWWTAWLNLIGQFAIVAGINFAAAAFLNATIITPLLANAGVTYDNTTVILAVSGTNIITGQLLTMGILMLVQLVLNIAGINLVALLNQVSVWWHIAIVALVVVLIFAVGKPDISGLTLFKIEPQDVAGSWENSNPLFKLSYGPAISYPVVLAFLFSLLLANWTYTGYDASAHVAEETVGARMSSAWGVFLSVAVSAIVGFIFLLALTTHLPDLKTLFPAELNDTTRRRPASTTSVAEWRSSRSSSTTSTASSWSASAWATCWRPGSPSRCAFCGLASVAAAGRMLFAFAVTTGFRRRAGSRRCRTAIERRPTPSPGSSSSPGRSPSWRESSAAGPRS